MELTICIFVFIFGAVIGSFLNVCIYRIPLRKSIVYPPSSCPNCDRHLTPLELIPILSFLVQKGKCRGCGSTISWQYPMIELLTALCYLAAFLLFGWSLLTLKVMIFVSFMIVIAIIDLQTKLIPDILSIPGMILGLLLSYQHIIHALIAAAIGFAIIFIIVVVSRGGMGLGDAKLLSMIGAFWGWQSILYTLFLGSLFGSIVGITLLVTHKIERKTHIPFAPFLAMGSVLAMFYVLQVLGIKL